MTKQISFSKHENEVLHGFRNKMNTAESTEDVKKFFNYTVIKLLNDIFEDRVKIDSEDIRLKTDGKKSYLIEDSLLKQEGFQNIWNNSDIKRILGTFADISLKRYKHLETNPEKTKLKIKNNTR
ncbi:MAG: hypothetical protein OQK71_09635 [Desulfobacter sp.]|uniref:hypothetical protein n=1 Tax=uncultured Desulfobacter sp. TaxID=240139 RepID=UPI0029C6B566|nr:hypothetical protein [uncultured Desulfobacter sp.]MCW8801173.1 hypothetical protein [Desulfobacter sp.]